MLGRYVQTHLWAVLEAPVLKQIVHSFEIFRCAYRLGVASRILDDAGSATNRAIVITIPDPAGHTPDE